MKQRTFENYEYVLRVHLLPTLGRIKLKALAPGHVRRLYREKLGSGLSARMVRLMHTVLHKALKQAVRWEYLGRNVTEAVGAPGQSKSTGKEIHPLTRDQAHALLEAARGDRLEALYVLAIHCGLRQGELLGLRWEDVDLEGTTLSVRQQLTRTKENGLCFTAPKSKKSRRSIRLTKRAAEALKRHKAAQNEE